jgi:hypothetical protein
VRFIRSEECVHGNKEETDPKEGRKEDCGKGLAQAGGMAKDECRP